MSDESGEQKVVSQPEWMSIDAVIIRADGTREELGTISYSHRNPLKELVYKLKRKLDPRAKA